MAGARAATSGTVSEEAVRLALACLDAAGGLRGVQLLLGMRRTFKSVDMLPPPRSVLLASFQKLHTTAPRVATAKTTTPDLTVGARALTKHCGRSKLGWWGSSKGNDAAKNRWAVGVVTRILDECTWANAHLLPHDLAMFEVRVQDGYGARWTADGAFFRGFLEPQMPGGHENGWKH